MQLVLTAILLGAVVVIIASSLRRRDGERVFVRRMVRQCRSKDEIKSALVAQGRSARARASEGQRLPLGRLPRARLRRRRPPRPAWRSRPRHGDVTGA
jgi:hypothetical protein